MRSHHSDTIFSASSICLVSSSVGFPSSGIIRLVTNDQEGSFAIKAEACRSTTAAIAFLLTNCRAIWAMMNISSGLPGLGLGPTHPNPPCQWSPS